MLFLSYISILLIQEGSKEELNKVSLQLLSICILLNTRLDPWTFPTIEGQLQRLKVSKTNLWSDGRYRETAISITIQYKGIGKRVENVFAIMVSAEEGQTQMWNSVLITPITWREQLSKPLLLASVSIPHELRTPGCIHSNSLNPASYNATFSLSAHRTTYPHPAPYTHTSIRSKRGMPIPQ